MSTPSRPIASKVFEIAAEVLGQSPDSLSETSRIEDLGGDSLLTMDLFLCFEEELAVQIPDQTASKLNTLGDCIAYIEAHTESAV